VAAGADRFGLGWRPELAAAVLAHRDRIDVVEVIAEDWFERSPRALRLLAAQVPVALHGIALGPASEAPLDGRRAGRMARLCGATGPLFWSEHLAFVRGGGLEIGHLAAPPRTPATVDATAANLARAATVVGTRPLVENIATLIDPPGSALAEPDWLAQVIRSAGVDLLLDLHNLWANATNFGIPPLGFLDRLPADRIAAIHLAGGSTVAAGGATRILDDHLHPVPDPVWALLEEVGARVARPLTVILERDGRYPPFPELLDELDRARAALAAGRARRR
jgi:uncharacterized protein (UPF0276 family)